MTNAWIHQVVFTSNIFDTNKKSIRYHCSSLSRLSCFIRLVGVSRGFKTSRNTLSWNEVLIIYIYIYIYI